MPEDVHILITQNGSPVLANQYGQEGYHRPATPRDQAKEIEQQFTEGLEELANEGGFNELEYKQCHVAMHQCLADMLTAEAMHYEDKKIDHAEKEYRVALAAQMINEIISHRGMLETPAILGASTEQLRQWTEHYQKTTREAYMTMIEIETELGAERHSDKGWQDARAQFERHSYYLWQCERRLGKR